MDAVKYLQAKTFTSIWEAKQFKQVLLDAFIANDKASTDHKEEVRIESKIEPIKERSQELFFDPSVLTIDFVFGEPNLVKTIKIQNLFASTLRLLSFKICFLVPREKEETIFYNSIYLCIYFMAEVSDFEVFYYPLL